MSEEQALVSCGDNDYELAEGQNSAWITIGSISVYVRRTDEGAAVDMYPRGDEFDGEPLASCYAFENEAKAACP